MIAYMHPCMPIQPLISFINNYDLALLISFIHNYDLALLISFIHNYDLALLISFINNYDLALLISFIDNYDRALLKANKVRSGEVGQVMSGRMKYVRSVIERWIRSCKVG
jgi:hypothetical protein